MAATLAVSGCAAASVYEGGFSVPLPADGEVWKPAVSEDDAEPSGEAPRQVGTVRSQFGCTVEYAVFEPADEPSATVMIAHGFMRDYEAMTGWAAAAASLGFRAVAVSFCNSSWFAGRHDRNAADLRAVADVFVGLPGADTLVYVGFSAGGLSAFLAASADPNAVGYVGLDAVDSGRLAEAVDSIAIPAVFLFGEPNRCNAEGNFVPVLPQGDAVWAYRVALATHCGFEWPFDPACARLCGTTEPAETAAEVIATIRHIALESIRALSGASEAGSLQPDAGSGDRVPPTIDGIAAPFVDAGRIEPILR